MLEKKKPVAVALASGVQRKASTHSTSGSFLSLGTVHIESGEMSPTFNVAKAMPPATASRLHHWESVEVIEPDSQTRKIQIASDPFQG